jgi:hypothetical protein
MAVFDLDDLNPGIEFEFEGGGRVWLRVCAGDDFKAIRKKTTKKKVEFRAGQRHEFEVTDDDLQSKLLWDFCIVRWEDFFDKNGKAIPCNSDTKSLLMGKSMKFSRFVLDKINELTNTEDLVKEEEAKNL